MARRDVQRALALLGPLEARIMREVWSDRVVQPFVVWDVNARMPELAYTTVMTTVVRLADKGLLKVERLSGQRALRYRSAGTPSEYLAWASNRHAQELVTRFGEAALAAFETQLGRLTDDQRRRLREVSER
jgi:predicted transcriptional regulator